MISVSVSFCVAAFSGAFGGGGGFVFAHFCLPKHIRPHPIEQNKHTNYTKPTGDFGVSPQRPVLST
jgi:hypothetical protein